MVVGMSTSIENVAFLKAERVNDGQDYKAFVEVEFTFSDAPETTCRQVAEVIVPFEGAAPWRTAKRKARTAAIEKVTGYLDGESQDEINLFCESPADGKSGTVHRIDLTKRAAAQKPASSLSAHEEWELRQELMEIEREFRTLRATA